MDKQFPFESRTGKRISREEALRLAYKMFDVHVLDGFKKLVGGEGIEAQEGLLASFRTIGKGWRIFSKSGSSLTWETEVVPKKINGSYVVFIFLIAMGHGKPYPQPRGHYELFLNDKHILDIAVVKYSQLWQNGDVAIYYDIKRSQVAPEGCSLHLDKWINQDRMANFGIALLKIPKDYLVSNHSARLSLKVQAFYPSDSWIRIDRMQADINANKILDLVNWFDPLREMERSKTKSISNGFNAYFGDIHSHSECGFIAPCGLNTVETVGNKDCYNCSLSGEGKGNGCGFGTIAQNFHRARYLSGLDFFALTDHDFQIMNKNDWQVRVKAARRFEEKNKFICLPAYEYTSWMYGHRNIYFIDDDSPLIPSSYQCGSYAVPPFTSPDQLTVQLDKNSIRAIIIPHHPIAADHPFSWKNFNAKYNRMVEIFSGWGNSENGTGILQGYGSDKYKQLSIKNALKAGLRFGFVAGSDSHDGYPGLSQGSGRINWANKFSEVGSGLTVVLSDNLDRENIFTAISKRRAYATTGARILIGFFINGSIMGSEINVKGDVKIQFEVEAPTIISRIDLIRNGINYKMFLPDSSSFINTITDKGTGMPVDNYYLRVTLCDREMAWSTPVWVLR